MTKSKSCTLLNLCNTRIKWPYFQEILKTTLDNSMLLKTDDDDIICAVESFNCAVQQECNAEQQFRNQYRIFIDNKRKINREKKASQAMAD